MTAVGKQKLYQISEEILQALLNYKNEHHEFTFSLRTRDSTQSEEPRLENGQWFQGSDYIYVPFFKPGDKARKIKTIGFVITIDDDGNIDDNFIEISFKGGIDSSEEKQFHSDLASQIGLHLNSANHGTDSYDDCEAYLSNLDSFLTEIYPLCLELLKKDNLSDKYLISEEEFQKNLRRINDIKSKMKPKKSSGETSKEGIRNDNSLYDLNTILYGPPGTGKTYSTIGKALEIIGDDIEGKTRKEIQQLFKQRMVEKRIVFTTFHQSMSYEDFIEGIKPVKPEQAGNLHFEVVDGIFKNICSEAVRVSHYSVTLDENEKELTKELFETLYYSFSATLPLHNDSRPGVQLQTKENYSFELFKNTAETIVVKSGEKKANLSVSQSELSAVLFDNKKPFYTSYENIIIEKILEGKSFRKEEINNKEKNFVLIIDEINRGNIAQIFGELISLIEDDKRAGKPEEIRVMLPYSKKIFSVPANVHIVGTMNTADRSVEALDTALRRRFVFEEMMPKPTLLSPYYILKHLWSVDHKINIDEFEETLIKPVEKELNIKIDFEKHRKLDQESYDMPWEEWEKVDPKLYFKDLFVENDNYIDLEKLLDTINKRLTLLIDKDHTIGHAWLMGCNRPEKLRQAFENKIIPLLKEFFYNDHGKIGLVLGDAFVKVASNISPTLFASFTGLDKSTVSEFAQKKLYELKMPDTDEELITAFQSIYTDKRVTDGTPS